MTFEELELIDKENAFFGWRSVKNAKESGLIAKKYWEFFEDNCTCGSENIIRSNLKAMMCCDPKCPIKQGYALAEVLSRFGIKGLKEATCSKIYNSFRRRDAELKARGEQGILLSDSFVAALAVRYEDYPIDVSSTSKGSDYYHACCQILSEPITFPKLVAKLAIPSLGSSAEKMMAGYSSFEELLADIKKAGSVYNFCVFKGHRAESVAFNLRQSLFDIATADRIMSKNIRHEGISKLNVCMTGIVVFRGAKSTKEKFLKMCNDLCCIDGVQILEINMTSAKETNPFILYSRPSSDSKYVTGSRRGEIVDTFGPHPVLFNTDLFYEFLEKVVEKWQTVTSQRSTDYMKTNLTKIFPTILRDSMQEVLHPELQKNQEILEVSESPMTETVETMSNPMSAF